MLALLGALLVAVVLLDVAWTTVAAGSGGGPLTTWLSRGLWQVALVAHERRDSHGALAAAGTVLVFVVVVTWITLALAGWTIVFSATEGAVRVAETGEPASFVERFYFAGYTMFTLGLGDVVPGDGVWRVATVAATGTGLALMTLSITYLVPLASAVAQRRQLGSHIATLGDSPEAILLNAWRGRAFDGLDQHLATLVLLLHTTAQNHLAYPVLHFFHSRTREHAAAPNIANLALAVDLLETGVACHARPPPAVTRPVSRTIDMFLDTVGPGRDVTDRPALPAPSLDPLRDAGIPVDDDGYGRAVQDTEKRRGRLADLLAYDGWSSEAWR